MAPAHLLIVLAGVLVGFVFLVVGIKLIRKSGERKDERGEE